MLVVKLGKLLEALEVDGREDEEMDPTTIGACVGLLVGFRVEFSGGCLASVASFPLVSAMISFGFLGLITAP